MSHVGQSRHYAEERDEPPRRGSIPWKYSPPSKASEYHLIDLVAGCSEGGFERWPGLGKAPARGLVGVGSSTAMFGLSTTIRVETNR